MKKMKRLKYFVMVALLFGFIRNADALTLGLPDIGFDTRAVSGGGLNYNYDASSGTGTLHVTAGLNFIKFPNNTITHPGGTISYSMKFLSESSLPAIPALSFPGRITGNFGTIGGIAPDLKIFDGSSTLLLSGNFISSALGGDIGDTSGKGTATFSITGGTLKNLFVLPCSGNVNCGGMLNLNYNLNKVFRSGMFAESFTGHTKGDIAPVPEPGTIFLLGISVLGTGLWGRWKSKS